ncbi:Zcf27p [Collariella sp. IMI 366227]|nr:Zcf27p [Collariella sp. IMI 366227]
MDRCDDLATIASSTAVEGDTSSLSGSPVSYYSPHAETSRLTIETILSWNVFEDKFESGTNLKALIVSPTAALCQEPFLTNTDPRLERLDLDPTTCSRLLHIFLEQVHIANPILDVPLVTNYLYQAPEMSDDVLQFVLRGHLLDCYEWVYFPYLLEAIAHHTHHPLTDEFVARGLQMSAERIHKNRKGFRHRHHGVWLMLRSCTRSALVLLAASRCPPETAGLLPVGWKDAVLGAVEMLTYWRDEAQDAMDRLSILTELIEDWLV